MKTKLFVFLFLAGSIIPNLLFAQYTQQGPKLVGTGSVGSAHQGYSVAISSDGNTALVGGPQDNGGLGAAWVYTRSNGVWVQQGSKLIGTGAIGTAAQCIVAVSSDGNTAIVGGAGDNGNAGAVWVFIRSGGVWSQQGPKLVGTGASGNAIQGVSVAISSDGNTAIVGGPNDNSNAGAVWIFTRSGGVWSQQGPKLIGSGAFGPAWQGWSVAISADGNTAVVGGYNDNSNSGAVWVFTRSGGVWTQQGGKLYGSDSVFPSAQGMSVAVSSDGNTLIFGGNGDNSGVGAVWVFTRSGGVWTQQGSKLVGTGAVGPSAQGISCTISSDGNIAVVGGWGDNGGKGAVWVFIRNGSVWTQQGQKLIGTDGVGNPGQGYSVGISSNGNTVVEGGEWDNGPVGAAWIFFNPSIGISQISSNVPSKFSLEQNYPNPFNPTTKFKFQIAKLTNAKITVFDVLGREVATLVNEQLQPGTYEVDWNAANYPSGVYYYKISAGDPSTGSGQSFTETRKMVLIK